jgi:heme-degrading monooxygenase HmoA
MIERHITFDVLPDQTDAFERFIAEQYRPPVLEMPGLIECSLLREADSPTRYQLVFRWEQPDDAVAWRVSEVHRGLQPGLNALHAGMVVVAYVKVV